MTVDVPTARDMQGLAANVASHCQAGDVLVLDGDLGAGKTTFAQGFGRALGVREPITSPTFVIARVHRVPGRLGLVHVDAYRLGSALELDDLDLDADLAESVTLVEWGQGIAERLAGDRLHVRIDRSADASHEARSVTITAHGQRWSAVSMDELERVGEPV